MTTSIHLSAPVRDGLGIGVAVGVAGLAFGAAAVTAGFSPLQAAALSTLAFTGASQFALVGVVAGGGSLVAGVAGALLLGARNTLYGLRLAHVLGWHGARRALASHGVIDETAAVALAQADRADARKGFIATFASVYLFWGATTVVGALATERVGDTGALGLDAVGPAIFLGLLWPRLRDGGPAERRRACLIALAGAVIAVSTAPLLPPGVPVLLAAAGALIALTAPDPARGAGQDRGGEARP